MGVYINIYRKINRILSGLFFSSLYCLTALHYDAINVYNILHI